MRALAQILSALLATVAIAAYGQDASIRVGGSTTALPIISSCAAHFMEKHASWDKADPSLGKEQTVVYVTGGGSGFGVKGLMNGTIDIGGTHEALRAVDPALREAANALGVSHTYLFARVVWPVAWPAILTSIVLAAVHALGSAAPLLFTAATVFTKEAVSLFRPVMALPTHLYYVTSEIGATPYAFGSALVLAIVILCVSAMAFVIKRRKEV